MIDYNDGRGLRAVAVPHAWNLDVPVVWEGPARYSCSLQVPGDHCWLVFHGVSYAAEVLIEGRPRCNHQGLWDAFSVDLGPFSGEHIQVEVLVIKNGGSKFPVNAVASGFLPYVFHTFGGIYREVELIESSENPLCSSPSLRPKAKVEGREIYYDGKPIYIRGLLHWGWYPNLGHPNPPISKIRDEIAVAKLFNFNLVKFCLWIPPHGYLEELEKNQMHAWIELPLWNPVSDPGKLDAIGKELERIVLQYRHHQNILLWTIGCELSDSTTPEFRKGLVQMVKAVTDSPLVKDNSGGAEMYGGDPREYGDFEDFHPYCDTPFYPAVLDSLLPGPRTARPALLGEFNDIDVHRDLVRLAKESPYWSSADPALNDKGVRWLHDLPDVLETSPLAKVENSVRAQALADSSLSKAQFVRKFVQEAVRSRDAIGGYVITGWRDTPISTSGFFDDWDKPRFEPEVVREWNSAECLFIIPQRGPPWVKGGNRPGWRDSFNWFVEPILWRIGCASEKGASARMDWHITDDSDVKVAEGFSEVCSIPALEALETGQIFWEPRSPGRYVLNVRFGENHNRWRICIHERPNWETFTKWSVTDNEKLLGLDLSGTGNVITTGWTNETIDQIKGAAAALVFLNHEHTLGMPFWRESAYEFLDHPFWDQMQMRDDWERWLPISPDCVIDPEWLSSLGFPFQILLRRVDMRTYAEHPILVMMEIGDCRVFLTTVRPYGGLGCQPPSLMTNPSGCAFVASLTRFAEQE